MTERVPPGSEVAPGVHRLGTDLVNWYLVVDRDGALTAVDSGLSGYAELMRHELEALGHSPEDVRAVVLTHGHADHTGLAGRLAAAGARILIHGDDAGLAARPRPQRTDGSVLRALVTSGTARRFFLRMARDGGLRPPRLTDVETFAHGDQLDVPGRPCVIHTPGHTAGHCALHFPDHRALFAGDLLCTFHFITERTGPQTMPRATNVDTAQSVASLSQIEPVDATVVLPGHGDPFEGSPAEAAAQARSVEPV